MQLSPNHKTIKIWITYNILAKSKQSNKSLIEYLYHEPMILEGL